MIKDEKKFNSVLDTPDELNNLTDSQILSALEQAKKEEALLDLELKREQVRTIKEKRAAMLAAQREKTKALEDFIRVRRRQQEICNHLKGGFGVSAVMQGQGDGRLGGYAVIKHRKPNGTYMVLCTRCNKEWHDQDRILGTPATPGFSEAIRFNTDNSPSSSTTFIFDKVA
jgi:hypothetical protein